MVILIYLNFFVGAIFLTFSHGLTCKECFTTTVEDTEAATESGIISCQSDEYKAASEERKLQFFSQVCSPPEGCIKMVIKGLPVEVGLVGLERYGCAVPAHLGLEMNTCGDLSETIVDLKGAKYSRACVCNSSNFCDIM